MLMEKILVFPFSLSRSYLSFEETIHSIVNAHITFTDAIEELGSTRERFDEY